MIVDFAGVDAWFEEDERNVGHPKDPFHRIDILHSSRPVRVELDGEVLAESTDVYFLFEPPLPVRYYLPLADVRTDLLTPSATTTYCAYKGQASHWSLAGEDDVAWSYEEPLRDAQEVTRPHRVLRRAARRHRRRQAARSARHTVVSALSGGSSVGSHGTRAHPEGDHRPLRRARHAHAGPTS